MKWIRRKPSVRVHSWTPVVCIMVLIPAALWISGRPNYQASTPGRWIPGWNSGPTVYTSMLPWPTCYVTRLDGKMQMLGDGVHAVDEAQPENLRGFYLYYLNTSASGILAPTRMHIRHHLDKQPGTVTAHPQEFFAISRRWGLGLTPDEDGFMAMDPRIKRLNTFEESRPIWSGYAANTVALLGISGILWSIAWVPACVRSFIRSRRVDPNLCPVCKYDVCATPGRCPECGWGQPNGTDKA